MPGPSNVVSWTGYGAWVAMWSFKAAHVCSVAQSGLALCGPMDCSPPGSSVHGILQARTGCHSLLQGIFPTQGSNLGFMHCRQILYHPSHQGSPYSHLDEENSNFWLRAKRWEPLPGSVKLEQREEGTLSGTHRGLSWWSRDLHESNEYLGVGWRGLPRAHKGWGREQTGRKAGREWYGGRGKRKKQ